MTPIYEIKVGDRDITPSIAGELIRLSVNDKVGVSADTADVSLHFDGSFAIPRAGVALHIKIGYAEEGLWDVGAFIVEETELSGPPDALNIRGTSMPLSPVLADSAALQGGKDRAWRKEVTTFADVVNEVCEAAKLTTKIDPALASIKMPFTVQMGESDAEFLQRITGIHDGIIKYHDTQVIFEKKDSGKLGTISIAKQEVDDYGFTFSERNAVRSVVARWQETADGEVKSYEAGSGVPQKIIKTTYPDENTAKAAAESLLKKLTRTTAEARLTLPTRPGLLAEVILKLDGFPPTISDREFIIESATHTLDALGGLRSVIQAKQRG